MANISFTKMHGCGNDYIYIDGEANKISASDKPELVKKLSDRHFGIGGDGVIFINRPESGTSDFEMEMYNADGSRAEMCGNGIRCVAKFVYEKGLIRGKDMSKDDLVIESCGKQKFLRLTIENEKVTMVKVDMGEPILNPSDIPVIVPDEAVMKSDKIVDYPITVIPYSYRMTCVSMGNPHAVVFLNKNEVLSTYEIKDHGAPFEVHQYFPKKTNVEFVHVDDRSNVHMRVWERGTGETLACGTGCCAVTTSCILNGLTDDTVHVHVLGGEITCTWDKTSGHIFMSGPATTVFEGSIEY